MHFKLNSFLKNFTKWPNLSQFFNFLWKIGEQTNLKCAVPVAAGHDFMQILLKTRKSCFSYRTGFHCHTVLLFLCNCFNCTAVSKKYLLLLWCFYCFNNVSPVLLFLQSFYCILDLGKMSSIHEFHMMLKSHLCCCQVISEYQRQRVYQ